MSQSAIPSAIEVAMARAESLEAIPAMTDPLGRYWDQPRREDIEVTEKEARMSQATFRCPDGIFLYDPFRCLSREDVEAPRRRVRLPERKPTVAVNVVRKFQGSGKLLHQSSADCSLGWRTSVVEVSLSSRTLRANLANSASQHEHHRQIVQQQKLFHRPTTSTSDTAIPLGATTMQYRNRTPEKFNACSFPRTNSPSTGRKASCTAPPNFHDCPSADP